MQRIFQCFLYVFPVLKNNSNATFLKHFVVGNMQYVVQSSECNGNSGKQQVFICQYVPVVIPKAKPSKEAHKNSSTKKKKKIESEPVRYNISESKQLTLARIN